MRRVLAVGFAVALLSVPVSMHAWGMDAHRFLTRRALDGLPPSLKPFFDVRREFVSEHAADPDLWRVVGLKNDFGNEDPNHFFDIDALDDPPPFRNVPHEWTEFVAKYAKDRAMAAGRLPWRADEIYKKLVATFQEIGRPAGSPYAPDNARYLSAILAHYIEDAHVPFHATSNHDGQLTNQRGLHSRFETELVARSMASLKLAPVTVHRVGNVRDFVFDTLVESQALVAPILRADREAAAGREFYDDRYFAKFSAGALPIAEKRMSDAASAVASVIDAAWEEAGKPPLPLAASKTPARIRR